MEEDRSAKRRSQRQRRGAWRGKEGKEKEKTNSGKETGVANKAMKGGGEGNEVGDLSLQGV